MIRSCTRRRALQLLGGAALATVPAARIATPAAAGRNWCRTDPVLFINGENGHAYVAADQEMKRLATGPIELVVDIPVGITFSASPGNNGFGYGWIISFREDPTLIATKRELPVRLNVYCPASANLPIGVGMEPSGGGPLDRGSASGTANVRYVTALCQSDAPGNSAG